MPAAPAAPPPTAKPAGVTIIDTPAPKPPPPPTSTINVSAMPTTAQPSAAPKKAMSRIREGLEKLASKDSVQTPPAQPKAPAVKSQRPEPTPVPGTGDVSEANTEASPPPDSVQAGEGSTETTSEQSAASEVGPEKGKQADKGKPSPWKLVDQYKATNANLQKEIAALRAQITPETDRKALQERTEKAETLAKQLADEIRYHAYEKSPEFKEKFHAPYEQTFARHLKDLSEVTVTDQNTGAVRKFTGDDLAQFAFMDFKQAKEAATALFPDFANDIMTARKDIRAAWDTRQAALNEWKDKGAQREQQMMEQTQKQRGELETFIRTTWEKANAEVTSDERHGHLFKPIEGDEEWNKRLTKGFELVDKSYSENPTDPRLTPEQRAQAVKRHAAVRARAAGWGALRFRNDQLSAKIAELEKELAQYKETTPATQGSETAPTETAAPAKAMDRLTQQLRQMAH